MKIGIDGTCWGNRRGFGRFTREVLTALFAMPTEHEFCLFTDQRAESLALPAHVRVVEVVQAHPVNEKAVADDRRSVGDLLAFTRATRRERPDVMYFPAVYSWFPVWPGIAQVVTFHDAIAESMPHLIFPNQRARLFWGAKVTLAKLQARRFMTVSGAAREEIVRHLGIGADRIDVVTEGPNAAFVPVRDADVRARARAAHGLPPQVRVILYVGGLAPHKNLSGLLRGMAAARRDGLNDVHVVLVGDWGRDGFHSNRGDLEALCAAQPLLAGCVHFAGYVPDETLAALYSDALAVAMPSFSEGFGLPAIEAMACGTPVLSSTAGSLPEIVGNAGLFFDPANDKAIAESIWEIASDTALHARLCDIALERAALYTWERAAELVLASLVRCVAER